MESKFVCLFLYMFELKLKRRITSGRDLKAEVVIPVKDAIFQQQINIFHLEQGSLLPF